jgi:hypothetical protein
MVATALFIPDGESLVPQPITQGPWSPDAQHGGPVAALLARCVERVETPAPMQVVRMSVELLRPVPLRALVASTRVVRAGKRVQIIDASLAHDGQDVAWARALLIRTAPMDDLPGTDPARAEPRGPESVEYVEQEPGFRVPYAEAVEIRFLQGGWDEPGPVRIWTRLGVPVVEGEAPSPLQRTAAAADFGNGVSWVVPFDSHVFINPDLTVSLSRVPRGEWIGFGVESRFSPEGFGTAESEIFDRAGPVGRAIQSLYVERR